MDSLEVKERLHQYIDTGDETLIKMMWEAVADYHLQNTSSSVEEYNKDIEESLEEFKRGEFISQKELEEQSEKW